MFICINILNDILQIKNFHIKSPRRNMSYRRLFTHLISILLIPSTLFRLNRLKSCLFRRFFIPIQFRLFIISLRRSNLIILFLRINRISDQIFISLVQLDPSRLLCSLLILCFFSTWLISSCVHIVVFSIIFVCFVAPIGATISHCYVAHMCDIVFLDRFCFHQSWIWWVLSGVFQSFLRVRVHVF